MTETTEDRLTTLQNRVAQGIEWLNSHDPDGSFTVWFQSGLTARSPMPGQSEERRAEWVEWHKARLLWGGLDRQLQRIDPQWKEDRAS